MLIRDLALTYIESGDRLTNVWYQSTSWIKVETWQKREKLL